MSDWVRCSRCGKRVSNVVPGDLTVRAFIECPECIAAAAAPPAPGSRWEATSYADATEAAIHHALIEFTLAVAEREGQRTATTWPDLSDLYRDTRRLVHELATGKVNADEWRTELEERNR